jgi:hypothetical protein
MAGKRRIASSIAKLPEFMGDRRSLRRAGVAFVQAKSSEAPMVGAYALECKPANPMF